MASQLAAQDYLARLSASAGGLSFGGLTSEGMMPGFDLLQAQQALGNYKCESSECFFSAAFFAVRNFALPRLD
jgi:hypothetical protein